MFKVGDFVRYIGRTDLNIYIVMSFSETGRMHLVNAITLELVTSTMWSNKDHKFLFFTSLVAFHPAHFEHV